MICRSVPHQKVVSDTRTKEITKIAICCTRRSYPRFECLNYVDGILTAAHNDHNDDVINEYLIISLISALILIIFVIRNRVSHPMVFLNGTLTRFLQKFVQGLEWKFAEVLQWFEYQSYKKYQISISRNWDFSRIVIKLSPILPRIPLEISPTISPKMPKKMFHKFLREILQTIFRIFHSKCLL